MTRRELLLRSARLAGVASVWAALPASTWAALPAPAGWSAQEEEALDLIGDTILPATPGSPGAASVGIGRFIARMTEDCFAPEAGVALRRGRNEIEAAARAAHGRAWRQLSPAEREKLLTAYEGTSKPAAAGGVNPFAHLKRLTLLGYFTSEQGATKALRYDPVPGTYRGSLALAADDRAWAQ
ncbi:MAG: gluconate 2-dehydrogenase subunit 3 family protein [Opitutaceae bacterium]